MNNLFSEGTVHHAAELGSVKGIEQVEKKQKALRGLPAQVVLEERDELLQCVPLHVAAERGYLDVVKVRTTAGMLNSGSWHAMPVRACMLQFNPCVPQRLQVEPLFTDAGLLSVAGRELMPFLLILLLLDCTRCSTL
jgi:hypothetical protein